MAETKTIEIQVYRDTCEKPKCGDCKFLVDNWFCNYLDTEIELNEGDLYLRPSENCPLWKWKLNEVNKNAQTNIHRSSNAE